MQPSLGAPIQYDRATILFHWTTAALVAVQWIGAQTIDYFPSGLPRVSARSMHITIGIFMVALVAARLIWRATSGRRLPPANTGTLELLARATHWVLYLLLAAMLLSGLALEWTRGDNMFNLFRIPAYAPGNRALVRQVQGIHEFISWLILALAGLHAAAALVHRYLWHDGVLGRMLPGK